MKLSDFEMTEESKAVMAVLNPVDGTPMMNGVGPMTITVFGPDNPRMQAVMRKLAARRSVDRKLTPNPRTTEEAERNLVAIQDGEIDSLVAATAGWSGIGIDEDETPFSPEKAKEAYTRFPWLREQVELFYRTRANFLMASSKNS